MSARKPARPLMPPTLGVDLGLDPRVLADVAARIPVRRGSVLGGGAEADGRIFLVLRGQVLLRERASGRALHLLGPGEMFGEAALVGSDARPTTGTALTDCEIYSLPAAVVPRLAERYPQFTVRLLALIGQRLTRADRKLQLTGIDSAPQRLLALLGILAEQHGEPCGSETWLPLPVTQAELGELAGLVRETVVRSLAQLEADGEIRREGRRGLWLRNGERVSGNC
jgi:CRP/FNR family transcriptional regulator